MPGFGRYLLFCVQVCLVVQVLVAAAEIEEGNRTTTGPSHTLKNIPDNPNQPLKGQATNDTLTDKPLIHSTAKNETKLINKTDKPLVHNTAKNETKLINKQDKPLIHSTAKNEAKLISKADKPLIHSTAKNETKLISKADKPLIHSTAKNETKLINEAAKPFIHSTAKNETTLINKPDKPLIHNTAKNDTKLINKLGSFITTPDTTSRQHPTGKPSIGNDNDSKSTSAVLDGNTTIPTSENKIQDVSKTIETKVSEIITATSIQDNFTNEEVRDAPLNTTLDNITEVSTIGTKAKKTISTTMTPTATIPSKINANAEDGRAPENKSHSSIVTFEKLKRNDVETTEINPTESTPSTTLTPTESNEGNTNDTETTTNPPATVTTTVETTTVSILEKQVTNQFETYPANTTETSEVTTVPVTTTSSTTTSTTTTTTPVPITTLPPTTTNGITTTTDPVPVTTSSTTTSTTTTTTPVPVTTTIPTTTTISPAPTNLAVIPINSTSFKTEWNVTAEYDDAFYISINRTGKRKIGEMWTDCDIRNTRHSYRTEHTRYTFRETLPGDNYNIEVILSRNNTNSSGAAVTYCAQDQDSPLNGIDIGNETTTTVMVQMKINTQYRSTITDYAISVLVYNITTDGYCWWSDMPIWPKINTNTYRYLVKFEKFVTGDDHISYTLGTNDSCTTGENCNKPLKEDTRYFFMVTFFYEDHYYETRYLGSISTPKKTDVALILAIIFGLLLVSLLGFFGVIMWKKGLLNKFNVALFRDHNDESEEISNRTALLPLITKPRVSTTIYGRAVKVGAFAAYCAYLEQDPGLQKEQWDQLNAESREEDQHYETIIATLPENKRKNRYPNILPWDHSRVKLHIDEDDEISSDYINASYVNGFSGKIEYIATQGPLAGTCRDFWKMIIQENVTVIIMVSKFIENNRDKCYKYFPNNHETMMVGDDIEVRCSTELHFGVYCVRTLQVKKDLVQLSLTHMQFLEWPDFDVPTGTENILQFCHQMRRRTTKEGGLILVHCSAGVGRTGTLIAADILLQQIQTEPKISVHNTILEMRKQRKNMVQTLIQYMYIHQIVKSMLEDPIVDEQSNPEPLYENVTLNPSNSTFYVPSEVETAESAF